MKDSLGAVSSPLLGAIRAALQDSEWRQIEEALDAYFDVSLDLSSLGGNQKHQLCLFIRTGLSGALDVSRSLYLQAVSQTQSVISQYQNDRPHRRAASWVVPFEVKRVYSTARGYAMVVANKFKTQVPA